MLLRFKQYEAQNFIPKRIEDREEEAKKKGVGNYLIMAKNGFLKNLK